MGKSKSRLSAVQKERRGELREQKKLLKDNNGWEDNIQVYQKCVDLLQQGAVIAVLLEQPGIDTAIDDRATLNAGIRLISRDTVKLSGNLEQIFNQHKDKRGHCTSPDDFAFSLNLYEQYMQFMEAYRLAVQPTINEVMEIIHRAELKVNNALAKLALESMAQDPNSDEPIDVEVREVSVQTATQKAE